MCAGSGSAGRAGRLDGLALEPAALSLGHAAPDPEPLVMLERVLQALGPDLAAAADALGLAGRSALLREERLRICLCAQRLILPTQLVDLFWADEDLRQRDDDLSHSASSLPTRNPRPRHLLPSEARITPMKLHPRVLLQVKRKR